MKRESLQYVKTNSNSYVSRLNEFIRLADIRQLLNCEYPRHANPTFGFGINGKSQKDNNFEIVDLSMKFVFAFESNDES